MVLLRYLIRLINKLCYWLTAGDWLKQRHYKRHYRAVVLKYFVGESYLVPF